MTSPTPDCTANADRPSAPSPPSRPRRLAAFLGLLSLALLALPGLSGTLDASQVKETTFPNGLRLLVKEARATDLASVQVWIQAGGFLEDETTSGTAHAVEHLFFKGSHERGTETLDGEIENLGGLLEASTEKDWTRFTCTVNGRYAAKVITLVGEALTKPQFRAEDLQAEKPLIMEEIARVGLSPEANMSRVLHRMAYQRHPYAWDVRGIPRVIERLTIEDVQGSYRKHYIPSRITVVVVGDVDPAGIERVTRAAFVADKPGGKPEPLKPPPAERACEKKERHVIQTELIGGFLGIAYPAPDVTEEPDTHVMDVILTLLESGDGGRLPRLLKDTAAASATYETRRQSGLFTIIAATRSSDPEAVEGLIRKELDFLRTRPVPDAELALAKRALRGSYALDNETYAGQAGTLGYYASIDRWQFACDYLGKVEAVTADQVLATAQKFLDPERSVAMILRPKNVPGRPQTRANLQFSVDN